MPAPSRRRRPRSRDGVAAAGCCVLLAACGGGGADKPRARAQPAPVDLRALPGRVAKRCASVGRTRRVAVLCPTQLPAGRWSVRYRSVVPGPAEYVASLETSPPGSGAAYHVMAGGRVGHLPLRASAGKWPPALPLRHDLALVGATERNDPVRPEVLHPVSVAGHDGLLLQVAGFPNGGVHGGHLAVIWNQRGAGYVLSIHFASGVQGPDAMLLDAAASMSRSHPW